MEIVDSKKAVLTSAIANGVIYDISYSGDGLEEPKMVWTKFDHIGFLDHLVSWYGNDIANIVYDSFSDDNIEEIIEELATDGAIDECFGVYDNSSKIGGALDQPCVEGLTYRGTLSMPCDLTTNSTGNTYADGASEYKVGDLFVVLNDGTLTLSDGTINVTSGDTLIINTDIADSSITIAMIDDIHGGLRF